MKYYEQKMNIQNARLISKWKYEKPYEIYSFDGSEEAIDEFMNFNYFSVHNQNNLVGFYCTGVSAQVPNEVSKAIYEDNKYTDIGLGMRPDLTGSGHGADFVRFVIETAKKENPDNGLRLTVAKFNKRAIKVYKKLRFNEHLNFLFEKTNTEFIIMLRDKI